MSDEKKDVQRIMAAELRDDLLIIADQLDMHKKNVSIARVSGGVAGTVGGVIAGVGIGLAPFTVGVSAIVLGIVGGAIATSGATTVVGAQAFGFFNKRSTLKGVAKKWDTFCQKLKDDREQEEEEERQHDYPQNTPCRVSGVNKKDVLQSATRSTIGALKGGAEIGGQVVARAAVKGGAEAGGQVAARATLIAVARGVAATASVLNVFLIGFSLYDIIAGSKELSQGTGCEGGDLIREFARDLDHFAQHGEFPTIQKCGGDDGCQPREDCREA